jgi:lipopolysaccharide heptosyltransferase I
VSGTASAPSRVLVIRTSALGDVVNALPTLSAIRRSWPRARIAWVIDETFAPLLEGHGLLDEVLPVPLRRWRRGGGGRARELFRFVRRLRAFGAELALDLMGNHKGALIARLCGAPHRAGARRSDRREPSSALWINHPAAVPGGHSVERMLAIAASAGAEGRPVDFAPEALTCGRDLESVRGHVFLHPGAAWANKRLPPERWGPVASGLARRTGADIRVGAAPGEEALADAVVAASGGAARRLDAPTLGHLAAAIRGARLVLAGDTGALHLATALGVPVVAVHGPTDPALHGPYGGGENAVFRRLPCSFCHRRMGEAKACLLGIDPEEIARRAAARLAG